MMTATTDAMVRTSTIWTRGTMAMVADDASESGNVSSDDDFVGDWVAMGPR